ncbi:MFS transporter [Candidatus Saccharibacteria bacterium]|nr:MFS transporter [Candidatus Saccharibacteria bacterium]
MKQDPEKRHWRRNITFFLLGQGFSLLGSTLVWYAIMWYITLTTGSGLYLTLLLVAGTIPLVLMSPLGGVWADRMNRKWLINIADGFVAVVTLLIIIMFSFGFEDIWLLMVCIAARAFGQGVQMPAAGAVIPQIVPKENLARINGLNGMIQMGSALLAPMGAAALIAFMPVQQIMWVDVITAVISILILTFFVKLGRPIGSKDAPKSAWSDFKIGVKYIAKHRFVRALFAVDAIMTVLIIPIAILTPLIVARDFGGEAWKLGAIEVGWIAAALIGSGIITVWGGFKKQKRTLLMTAVIFGMGSVATGIAALMGDFWWFVGFIALAGLVSAFYQPVVNTMLQQRVEEKFMGRTYSVMTIIANTAMPAGMLIFGPLADIVSVNWLLIWTGVLIVLGSWPILSRKVFD